ncbi:unnamed protein product [marine sediment metagenome]|uniref:HTH arsR-type domain-containing protein n=1 Tax=marine sediment metagenome TaxID=412755 RepID=X1EK04_9ZZZZ
MCQDDVIEVLKANPGKEMYYLDILEKVDVNKSTLSHNLAALRKGNQINVRTETRMIAQKKREIYIYKWQ